jgi:hypothetical protein
MASRRELAPPTAAPSPIALSGDLAAVKLAIDLVRKGKTAEATSTRNQSTIR